MLLIYFLLGFIGTVMTEYKQNDTTIVSDGDVSLDDPYYPTLEWSDILDWKILTGLSEKSVNALFSPVSLKVALAMLYEASTGSTQKNFEDALQFISKENIREKSKKILESLHVSPTSENRIILSSRVFLDSRLHLKKSYTGKIKDVYNTDVINVNFTDNEASSQKINLWASESTLGSITRLVDPDEVKEMKLLLANAIFFKGVWRHQFPNNATCVSGFHTNPQNVIYVPFMTTTNLFYYFESNFFEARILRLPYKNSKFSMFFILPFSIGGLPSLIEKINLYHLHRELHYLDKRAVMVTIPKFSFKLRASYANILQQLGLRKIFQNSASFTAIAEGNSSILRELVISDILQSTGIEVDEKGSIAFAATDVIIGNKIGVPDNIFNASHPFLFFIQNDDTGTILFLGKIENPVYQELEIKKEPDDISSEFSTSVNA